MTDAPAASPAATSLNLLTRSGAIRVTFTPALSSSQYDQLLGVVNEGDDAQDLSALLRDAARSWARSITIDAC